MELFIYCLTNTAERQDNEPISLYRLNSTLYQYINALGGTI